MGGRSSRPAPISAPLPAQLPAPPQAPPPFNVNEELCNKFNCVTLDKKEIFYCRLNHWKEGIKQDEIQFVPIENVDGYKAMIKTILGLENDQFKECSRIFDELVDHVGSSYRKFTSLKNDKSLYGYFLCKKEENGTFSFFCALHSLEFELASHDGEPNIENLHIEKYQEKAVMVAVRPFSIRYGISVPCTQGAPGWNSEISSQVPASSWAWPAWPAWTKWQTWLGWFCQLLSPSTGDSENKAESTGAKTELTISNP